jgi:hypothetical protein
MGLLDDAIRQHLELKRRRGADPNEVERLEHEALGPVRRGTQVADEPLPDEEHLGNDEPFEHEEPFDDHEPFDDLEPLERRGPFEPQGPSTALYDDQAEDGFERSAPLAPETSFTDEPPEPAHEDRPERGWSHDSGEGWDVEEPREPAAPAAETSTDPAPAAASPPPAHARRPAPAEPGEVPPARPGQETVEYDVETEQRRERDEDVLEETPEFLQDTPDHDRLWFEQRPPRDFDFDK